MATELTKARRELVELGFCVIDDAMDAVFRRELIDWSNDLLATTTLLPRWKYQGSDIYISGERYRAKRNPDLPHAEIVDRLIEHPKHLMQALGIEDLRSGGIFQIIAKPAQAPPLYWHQDWARWDDPVSASPWPQQVFLNWYLTDTTPANGCLRVIPGSHRRRIDLHDHLVPPHEGGGYEVAEENAWMFHDHPEAVDVPVKAGQLVVADARLLHSTHGNSSNARRTLLLGWYYRKRNDAPDDWRGAVPDAIRRRPTDLPFRWNRVPGEWLQPGVVAGRVETVGDPHGKDRV